MSASVLWKELTAEDLRAKAAADAIVILPVASMEQHGPHLPVGVDTILCEGVCKAGAEAAAGAVPVVVAPTLWCGMAEHHMAFGGTFTFDIPTYRAVLLAFLKSIARHGFTRVLIVNGHGGNIAALGKAVVQLRREGRDAAWCPCVVAGGDAHAGHAETSLLLHISPTAVRTDRWRAGTSAPLSELLPSMRSGGVAAVSEVGVLGDPTTATATDGQRMLADMIDDCLRRILRWTPAADGMLT
jgi:mycofactocin precursor peptide peptidase